MHRDTDASTLVVGTVVVVVRVVSGSVVVGVVSGSVVSVALVVVEQLNPFAQPVEQFVEQSVAGMGKYWLRNSNLARYPDCR